MDKRTLSAVLWSAGESIFNFGVQFGVSLILARLLSPTDFGIYAMTGIFIGVSMILVDSGFSSALIQKKNTDGAEETAVFQFNILAAAVMAAVITAAAPWIARTYGYPILQPLLYSTAGIVFVNSLSSVPGAMMARRLEFVKAARLGLTVNLIAATCGVGAALLGAGIWTFAIQAGVSAVLRTAGVWAISGWRPQRKFDLRPARHLASFGSLLAVAGLLEIAYTGGYPLILGLFYGASQIGQFNRGQSLQALPANMISGVVSRMLFPILSKQAEDPAAMKSSARVAISWAMAVNTPAVLFLALFPELVIEVLFGAKWLPAAPVLTILAIGGVLYPLHVINLQVILAQGNSALFLKLEVVKKVLGVALVAVGCFFGITGLAVSQLVFVIIAFFINSRPSARLIGYSSFEQVRDVAGIWALSGGVMAACKALETFIGAGEPVRLIVLLLIGGTTYLLAALLLRIGPLHQLVGMYRSQWVVSP